MINAKQLVLGKESSAPRDMSEETPLFYHGEIVTVVPNRLLHDKRLSLQARFFWALIKSHYPRPFPGVRRLAGLAGCSLATAERYLAELETSGYLVRVKRAFSKTEYHLYDKPLQKRPLQADLFRVLNSRTREIYATDEVFRDGHPEKHALDADFSRVLNFRTEVGASK